MKKAFIIITAVLLMFTTLIIYSICYFQNSEMSIIKGDGFFKETIKKPKYHFAVIAQNTDDPFWQSVKKGCIQAADEYNAAIEFNGPRFTDIDQEIQYLNIAIASKVDGIVTHVLDEKTFTPLINKASDTGIPVVTIESDAKNSERKSYIGTNSYNLGTEAGKLAIQTIRGNSNIAIILNNYIAGGENVLQSLRVAGFQDALKSVPGAKISTIKTSSTGFFSAEEVTRTILINFPNVDTILCTSSKDTISVAQMIVDLNKVGQITIIGYDDAPEILRYIEKGVIYGTVVGNPVKSGYESIRALVEIKKNKMASSYIDTGVKALTIKNLSDYKKTLSVNEVQAGTK
jgi:ribose transport system substrate-binding protein